jgi:hypothetical protein
MKAGGTSEMAIVLGGVCFASPQPTTDSTIADMATGAVNHRPNPRRGISGLP